MSERRDARDHDAVVHHLRPASGSGPGDVLPAPRPVDSGTPRSAVAEDADRREQPVEASDRPPSRSITSWYRRSFAERRLGNRLDRELAAVAVVLHGRHVPGTSMTIDHVVVGTSGVWVIAAEHARGRVRRRVRRRGRQEGAGASGTTLLVGEDEQVALVQRVDRQAAAVRSVLYPIGFEWIDVHRAVCLTNATWRPAASPFVVDDVWVLRPRAVADKIAVPGPVAPDVMRTVAVELSRRLPAG